MPIVFAPCTPAMFRCGSPCSSPCALPVLAPLLLVILAPLLMKLLMFAFMPLLFAAVVCWAVKSIEESARTCESACARTDTSRGCCPQKVRDDKKAEDTVCTEQPKDIPRDLSSVSVINDDEIRIVVGVPGIHPPDLDVTVLDDVLHVVGESKTCRVDRRIALPRNADIETMHATHDLGQVTIVMQRKVSKRIPLVQRSTERTTHTASPDTSEVEFEKVDA